MATQKPLYPIKADPSTLDGVKVTLGVRGSVEGNGMVLDNLKMELTTLTDKNHLAADSMKVSDLTDTKHVECKKDSLVVLDTTTPGQTNQANLTVGKLEFTVGDKTSSLDSNQLTSDKDVFTLSNTATSGLLTLDAPTIELNGALSMPDDSTNTPNLTGDLGTLAGKYIRVKIGSTYYRLPLYNDA